MNDYMIFTVEETDLISIYAADSREKTIFALEAAYPYISEEDLRETASSALSKLYDMTDVEFSKIEFVPTGGEPDGE